MTAAVLASLLRRRRRPRPFSHLTRAQLEAKVGYVEDQRDFAIGETRATKDRLAAMLERVADSFDADADHLDRAIKPDAHMPAPTMTAMQRRAVADVLRDVARDAEDGAR